MFKIKIEIQGITPLLMNRFTEENEIQVSTGVSPLAKKGKGTPYEQAERKAYKDDKGNLYIPGPNIFACIIHAGTFHKIGKKSVTTAKTSLITAGMVIDDMICPLNTKEFVPDSRRVVIPTTGSAIMAHRPRLDEWKTSFTLEVFDENMFPEAFVRALVDDAGKKVGLGDFRPARKGPFGRFVVTGWKVEKDKKAA